MADETDPPDPDAPTGALPPASTEVDAMAHTAATGPGTAETGAAPSSDVDALAHTAATGPGADETGAIDGAVEPPADPLAHHRVPSDALFRWGHLYALKRLGAGGFGEVYRAYDPVLDRDVALKLHHEDDRSAAYLAEARSMARLKHPNVLAVHGADVHDGRAGIWTDLIDGRDFESIVKGDGPLSAAETIRVGIELCRALAAVHGAGMVHGDIKTHNVMRARGGHIVLMDFGAVSPVGGDSGANAGTLVAMSPELLAGAAPSVRSDIFALGVLLYRLSSATWPYADLSVAAVSRGDQPTVPLRDRRADLPSGFVELVERAMSADPAQRPASAGVMERALMAVPADGAQSHRVADTEPVPRPPGPPDAPPRSPWPTVLAVCAVGVALFFLLRPASDEPTAPPPATETPAATAEPGPAEPTTAEPAAPSGPPPRAKATVDEDETDPVDRSLYQVWRTPAGGMLLVPPHTRETRDVPSYFGHDTTAWRQPRTGSSKSSATRWSFEYWDPRVPLGQHALFEYRDGGATMDCGETKLTLTRVEGDAAAKLVADVQLKKPRWNRRSFLLARGTGGIFYYVDLLPGYERRGFRLFRGPKGALHELPLDVATVDEKGSLFASDQGDLRQGRLPYFVGNTEHPGAPDDIQWIAKDGNREALTALSTWSHAQMIHGDLQVYDSTRLGSPCDEVFAGAD